MSPRLALCFVGLAYLSACRFTSDHYCDDHPSDPRCNGSGSSDAGPDGPTACTSNTHCSGSTTVCDTGEGVCVQCTADEAAACTGASPVCGDDRACRACAAHPECGDSDACLPDGACAATDDVAYVAPAGSGTACTKDMPCATLAAALATSKSYIRLTGTLSEAVLIDNKNVTLLADTGSKLTRATNGVILEIRGSSNVAIFDLEITGASGAAAGVGISIPAGSAPTVKLHRVSVNTNTGAGIAMSGGNLTATQTTVSGNQGAGISSAGGSVTVARSTVSGNLGMGIAIAGGPLAISQSSIFMNRDGGISVSGTGATFNITNNFIYRNGDEDNASVGGVSLATPPSSTHRFEFNTIVDNRVRASAALAGGSLCDVAGFAAPNNVIARNRVAASTIGVNSQTFGLCTYPTSKIQATVADLNFKSPDDLPYDYRLTPGSAAIDQATTQSTIDVDHDGSARPSGGGKDQGAHEL